MFNNRSLLVMYINMFNDMNNVINSVDIINIFLFIFIYFNNDIKMIKYIIIEPVSGSKNVNIEGIIVIIDRVSNDLFFKR